MSHVKTCPYCSTALSINPLPVEKTASRCPHCKNILLLTDYGATVKKPFVYTCHKCGEESIFENQVPFVHCDKCNTFYITSYQGTEMIEADLLSKGDKNELPYTKKKDHYIAVRNKWRSLSRKTKRVYHCQRCGCHRIGGRWILSFTPTCYRRIKSLCSNG